MVRVLPCHFFLPWRKKFAFGILTHFFCSKGYSEATEENRQKTEICLTGTNPCAIVLFFSSCAKTLQQDAADDEDQCKKRTGRDLLFEKDR